MGWRAGAVLVGVVLSLTPAMLLAYNMDSGKAATDSAVAGSISGENGFTGRVIAQATGTATARPATATPTGTAGAGAATPPRTGTAGLAADGGTAAVAVALLLGLTVAVVAGGRVLTLRDRTR